MADDAHAVLFPESNQCIGISEVVAPFFRMDVGAFHAVLSYNGIEMLRNEFHCSRILFGCLLFVDGCSHQKLITEGILQRGCRPIVFCRVSTTCNYAYGHQQGKEEDEVL